VQTFTPEFIDAARARGHALGDRWFVDETYVKVACSWTCLYRAVVQNGQVIDVLLSERRNASAARAFFTRAMTFGGPAVEVTTDRALVYPRALDELVPAARRVLEQYANNVIEADHGRLKRIRSARTIADGHALVQNLRRGHYEVVADEPKVDRVRVAFNELAHCL
jgi:transposase, IS6 family